MYAFVHSGSSFIFSCPETKIRGLVRGLLNPKSILNLMFSHPLPFKNASTQLLFNTYYQYFLQELKTQRPNVVVVAYRDRLRFLAGLLASIEYQKLTVVADPYWQSLEWEALFTSLEVDWVFSDERTLQAPPSRRPKPDYTPWYGYILLPTGGSSGKLKLCIHSWENFRRSSEATAAFLGQKQLSSLSLLPPWHISGLMPFFRAYFTGGSFDTLDPKDLNVAQLSYLYERRAQLESESIFTSLVPTLLNRILEEAELCEYFRGFRGIFVGGAPLLGPTLQAALDKGLPILPTYGSTETASMISLHPLGTPLPLKSGYSGQVLPHATLALQDQIPSEGSFKLSLCCESLFYGYFPSQPERPNMFQTQDWARLEHKKQLYIEGRQDRIIISGGKKIDPLEVKTALFQTQTIQDCLAFALPHPEWGEVVALAYIPKKSEPSPEPSPQELKDALTPLLASYKIPKAWYAVAALPFNDLGKYKAIALAQWIQGLPTPVYT